MGTVDGTAKGNARTLERALSFSSLGKGSDRVCHSQLMTWALASAASVWTFLRWAGETSTGRGFSGLCGVLFLAWCMAGSETIARSGTWRGLDRSIAPHQGRISIEATADGAGRCTVQGDATTAVGSGWVFHGKTTVRQVACEVRVEEGGSLNALLRLRLEWHGRIKGIGGDDWDDADGYGDCIGPLFGHLSQGTGSWRGECRNDRHRWPAELEWTLDAD